MQNFNTNFKNYYLRQLEKLVWFKKPKTILVKKNDNRYDWFPDGKINVYYNCITNNLKKDPYKTALITINEKDQINLIKVACIANAIQNRSFDCPEYKW